MRDQELAAACVPGEKCPVESAFYREFTRDATTTFSFARQWLEEPAFAQTIRDLAIVELQKQRLSALIARDGITKPKKHAVSGFEYGLEATLAAGRYETALDNRFKTLIERLLPEPSMAATSGASD